MAMERIARRCKDPKSKDLQRLGLACFHHEGLADMGPGFNRDPGTMVERDGAWLDGALVCDVLECEAERSRTM